MEPSSSEVQLQDRVKHDSRGYRFAAGPQLDANTIRGMGNRPNVIDLTDEDQRIEVVAPTRPIVINLEDDAPPSTPRQNTLGPNQSLDAGIAALRQILYSSSQKKDHHEERPMSPRRVNEPELLSVNNRASAPRARLVSPLLNQERFSSEIHSLDPDASQSLLSREWHQPLPARPENHGSQFSRKSSFEEQTMGQSLVENSQISFGPRKSQSPTTHELTQGRTVRQWAASLPRLKDGYNHIEADLERPGRQQNTFDYAGCLQPNKAPLRQEERETNSPMGMCKTNQLRIETHSDISRRSSGKSSSFASVSSDKAPSNDAEQIWWKPRELADNWSKSRPTKSPQQIQAVGSRKATSISVDEINRLACSLIDQLADEHTTHVQALLSDAQKHVDNPSYDAAPIKSTSDRQETTKTSMELDDRHTRHLYSTSFDAQRIKKPDDNTLKLQLSVKIFEPEYRVVETEVTAVTYCSQDISVPRYKHYTTIKKNILSEEDDALRYVPYFDEHVPKKLNLLSHHYRDVIDELRIRHHREEQVKRLLPIAKSLLSTVGCNVDDVVHFLSEASKLVQIRANIDNEDPATRHLFTSIEDFNEFKNVDLDLLADCKPRTTHRIPTAGGVCKVMFDITGLSIWEVIRSEPRLSELIRSHKLAKRGESQNSQPEKTRSSLFGSVYTSLGCNVCFMHECFSHGGFDEGNVRQRFSGVPDRTTAGSTSQLPNAEGGVLVGIRHSDASALESPCSDDCFLKISHPPGTSSWSTNELELIESTLFAWRYYKTAACAYSVVLKRPCKEVYSKLCEINSAVAMEKLNATATTAAATMKKSSKKIDWTETKTHRPEKRGFFLPCDHSGPCKKGVCDCVDEDVACEQTCLCSETCKRRYQGCTCGRRRKPCRTENCECVMLNRECEPELCHSCGSAEALDPLNRADGNILSSTCDNVNLQRGTPKRTLLGISEVEGYGLFMGQAVKAREYLGEYVGELVSATEAERRGVIYDMQELSYLFAVNRDQVVDATRYGNKFRFINHSTTAQNCRPKVLFVNGVHRIAIFAIRDIEAGEELFFDYGSEYHTSFLSKEAKSEKGAKSMDNGRQGSKSPGGPQKSEKRESKVSNASMIRESNDRKRKQVDSESDQKVDSEMDERMQRRLFRAYAVGGENQRRRTRAVKDGPSSDQAQRASRRDTRSSLAKPATKHQGREVSGEEGHEQSSTENETVNDDSETEVDQEKMGPSSSKPDEKDRGQDQQRIDSSSSNFDRSSDPCFESMSQESSSE